ncbi:sporulation protein [Bacillus salacetis]|uniref:Sporulation protein n=1 Tax=Bacillus salacetis TaxID=2315464 RepID=A0A3A1R8L5_9BACI|nr:Spo0B C-terminal domain-containing protein [Bacillus salacetis]RIW37683.1 sporulation protein [Bacillus salacetis]
MKNEWNLVEALRHARHDWMNRLQLIKGNMDLGRTDRARQIIEEIVGEAQNESKLSNLTLPKFAELMLTYNWQTQFIKVEFEVLQAEKHGLDDGRLYEWFIGFFSVLEKTVMAYAENNLVIIINISQEDARFELDFNGIIEDRDTLRNWMAQQNEDVTIHTLESEGFLMTLRLNT